MVSFTSMVTLTIPVTQALTVSFREDIASSVEYGWPTYNVYRFSDLMASVERFSDVRHMIQSRMVMIYSGSLLSVVHLVMVRSTTCKQTILGSNRMQGASR